MSQSNSSVSSADTNRDLGFRRLLLERNALRYLPLFFLAYAMRMDAQSDATPPRLLALRLSPTPIDVITQSRSLTIDYDVSDDVSGTTTVYCVLTSPSGRQSISAPFLAGLVGGDSFSGTWRNLITIPRYSEAGAWKVSSVVLGDHARNSVTLNTATLQSAGFPTGFTVLSNEDLLPPTLTGFNLVPASAAVSNAAQGVVVSIRATDSVSGVAFNQTFPTSLVSSAVFRSPSNQQRWVLYNAVFTRSNGTDQSGEWQATFTLPRYSEPGTWIVESITLKDQANNVITYSSTQLSGLGFPVSVLVTDSNPDLSAPQLVGFDFSPTMIDSSHSQYLITGTFRLADQLSGVTFGPDRAVNFGFTYGARFVSPSGGQVAEISEFSPITILAGTALSGVWQGTTTIPIFSEAGTWRLERLVIRDAAHNVRMYLTSALEALGVQTSLVVTRPSLSVDGTVDGSGGTIPDTAFGARASIRIPAGLFSGTTDLAIDVLQTAPSTPAPRGFSANGTRFVNFSFTPTPAMPLRQAVSVVLPLINSAPVGSRLTLFRIDGATGSLVPAVDGAGRNIVGFVNLDGLSATFNGVIRFSVLVGLLSTGEVFADVNGDSVVDCRDLTIVSSAVGKRVGQAGYDMRADVNRNGVVEVLDLALVSRQLPLGLSCP